MGDEEKSLMDLPSPILLQILSTLPPTTLLHVKTLSKSYLNLTLDSEFLKLSRSASPASIIINQFNSFWINSLKLLRFVCVDNNCDHDPHVDLHLRLSFPIDPLFLVGSVHGFVCFNSFVGDADSIYILNPTTRQYIILPKPQGVRNWPNLAAYGFGFDPVRLQYKVVRIYRQEIHDDFHNYKSEAQVYTIGKGYWRSIDHVMFHFRCSGYGVNLYGKLHWLVYDANGNELICSFNLENELFESFPTAPGYNKNNFLNLRSLGVFGRCLCVCDNNADTHFEVWVMKLYRVTDSWVKQIVITITPEYNDWLCDEMINLVKVFDDGEVLFLWREDFLFLHHPVKKTLKRLHVCDGNFLASAHVSSSFSLKGFQGEVVKVF
ncbi:F-box protein CPR1-like [Solanum lycopersicum]|uniref:F-box protein CPR1-like n=1 Tax=Solanum lycopersicum TaxID=4081 RepID=UPI003747F7FB